jgi:hypothetical protein
MEQSRQGFQAFPMRNKNEYFLNRDDFFWLEFLHLYELYKEDALDVAIVRAWTL